MPVTITPKFNLAVRLTCVQLEILAGRNTSSLVTLFRCKLVSVMSFSLVSDGCSKRLNKEQK